MTYGKTKDTNMVISFVWMQNFWFLAFIYLFIFSKFYHEGYFICLNVFHFFGDKWLKKLVKEMTSCGKNGGIGRKTSTSWLMSFLIDL